MIIAFNKALNLHRRSNIPSIVARIFECNSAKPCHIMSKKGRLSESLASQICILSVGALHDDITVITLIQGHSMVIVQSLYGHHTAVQHGMHAYHTTRTQSS